MRDDAVDALNEAIRSGRCWHFVDEARANRWLTSDDARQSAPPGTNLQEVPRDCLAVRERTQGGLHALRPYPHLIPVLAARGWRWAITAMDGLESLLVEHPTFGWTMVGDRQRLGVMLTWCTFLPPDDSAPRRIDVWETSGGRWAATTGWDAAWILSRFDSTQHITEAGCAPSLRRSTTLSACTEARSVRSSTTAATSRSRPRRSRPRGPRRSCARSSGVRPGCG